MLKQLARFLSSVGYGNLLLTLILVMSAYNLYGTGQIIASVRHSREVIPMSTTYTDTQGDAHTVSSPVQSDPAENVRVHKTYLKAAYCVFPPQNPPEWFNPATDCQ